MISLFYIVTFLAAFLLFQIELVIAKILLPHYGGSYLVWGSCVVFFQAVLLLGYVFAHWLIKALGFKKYRYVHLLLLFVPFLGFPGRALGEVSTHPQIPFIFDVFWQLSITIGPVFFALSTISIVLQRWLASSHLPQRLNPYALYAVSNLGSFMGLMTYPFIFEYFYDLGLQETIWRFGYIGLFLVQVVAFFSIAVIDENEEKAQPAAPIGGWDKLSWFLYGMAGVILFLAVTNILTYEVAPVPLLWIVPLSIYLLSFVMTFRDRPICPEWIKDKLYLWICWSIFLYFMTVRKQFPFLIEFSVHSLFLLVLCLFCQNELYGSRPKDKQNLTLFYVFFPLGSFVGGVVVSWIIPLVSNELIEYLVGLFVVCLAYSLREREEYIGIKRLGVVICALALVLIWPMFAERNAVWQLGILFLLIVIIFFPLRHSPRSLCFVLIGVILLSSPLHNFWEAKIYFYKKRNYYGVHKVVDKYDMRFLMHGTTLHGSQFLGKKERNYPVIYYHPRTAVGKIFMSQSFEFKNIAAVGLGTGALAAYLQPYQTMDFFEIDSDVVKIAKTHFTYIKDTFGKVNFFLGDARLTLDKTEPHKYDLIVIDAFSGDAIPIHLLTVEALKMYQRHLKKDGIIFFHITNRYLNIAPVLSSNAEEVGAYMTVKTNIADTANWIYTSIWATYTWSADKQKILVDELKFDTVTDPPDTRIRPWTDEYSNILSVIRYGHLWKQLKR